MCRFPSRPESNSTTPQSTFIAVAALKIEILCCPVIRARNCSLDYWALLPALLLNGCVRKTLNLRLFSPSVKLR